MPVKRPAPAPRQDDRLSKGCYLSDGERLYRVLEVVELSVELENCMVPDSIPQWMPVREVLSTMKLVVPEP